MRAGESAIAVLTAVVDAVDCAVANNDNLCGLRDRAVDLIQVIAENAGALQAGGAYARVVRCGGRRGGPGLGVAARGVPLAAAQGAAARCLVAQRPLMLS